MPNAHLSRRSPETVVEEATTGFKMPERLANIIAEEAKHLPKDFTYRRQAKTPSDFQLDDGSRTDVSTVTTDAVDHEKEVVMPGGLDLSVFRANPVVPFAHDYQSLPVGKALWIRSAGRGLAAMTKYAKRPEGFTDWLPDAILSMQQEGMCTGKSIGFVPLNVREPTSQEIETRSDIRAAMGGGTSLSRGRPVLVVDKARLLEYSVCALPCNSEALTIAVSKCFKDAPDEAERLLAAAKTIAALMVEQKGSTGNPDVDRVNSERPVSCPKCQRIDCVTKVEDADLYTCSICKSLFDKEGDLLPPERMPLSGTANPPAKSAVQLAEESAGGVPFFSAETLAAHRKRAMDRVPSMIQEATKAAIAEAIDRIRGRV
jgi:hypothetical protein